MLMHMVCRWVVCLTLPCFSVNQNNHGGAISYLELFVFADEPPSHRAQDIAELVDRGPDA